MPSFRRKVPKTAVQMQAGSKTFLAPIGGWIQSKNLAIDDKMSAVGATVLENFFPTTKGIRPRGGSLRHATIDDGVVSLMVWRSGTAERLFATDNDSIYNITAPADPNVQPAADVAGLTSGFYSSTMFSTTGGDFLTAVNGADLLRLYDGSDWYPIAGTALFALNYDAETAPFTEGLTLTGGTSAATAEIVKVIDNGATGTLWIRAVTGGPFQDNETITDGGGGSATANGTASQIAAAITGIDTNDLSYVWVFKNRLFFIEGDTMNAWCLAVDAIGGVATQISLSGVFKKGGSMLFGATWSVDAGDGLDDICVFISTKGEVAAFAGTDPSDPNNWALQGVYDIGQPLGPNAHLRAGGDLVVATIDGLIPLSAAIKKDPAALTLDAVTRAIEDEWRTQAVARSTSMHWCCVKWIARNMAIIGVPTVGASEIYCYAVNLLTGAWAKYTGWDITAVADVGNLVYFGTPGGGVFLAEAGGTDDGETYFSTFIGRYDHMKSPTSSKTAKMARMSWVFKKPANPRVSFSFNYGKQLPSYPNAAVQESLDAWDVAEWDVGLWDQGSIETTTTEWRAVAGEGFAVAPAIQITNSFAAPPEAELVSIDLLYEMGGVAV